MKYAQIIRAARVLACGLPAVAGLCLASAAARADEIQSSVKSYNYVAAIRGGIYYNLHKSLQNDIGTPAGIGGVAISLEQEPLQYRTSLAVDYVYKEQNGNKLSMVPVNFEYQHYTKPAGTWYPYMLLGVGAAFVHLNDGAAGVNGEKTAFDTELGLGVDTPYQVFAEVRYNIVAPTLGEDFSGPDVLLGVRF